jgi:AraC-like DNA-binding protein/effector-binding domain-containing protein
MGFQRVQASMALAAREPGGARLEALAAEADLSPGHMHRVFTAVADETPKHFTSRLQLGKGAALLLTGRETVLRIALTCGFESHEGFTRAFRRRFAMSPVAYRSRGFASEVTREQALTHRHLVERVGPCVGLYHIRPDSPRRGSPMSYDIKTKDLEAQAVLVARRRVSHTEIAGAIGEVVGGLFQMAQQEGIALTGHPFTRYLEVGPGLMTIEPGMRIASDDTAPAAATTEDADGAPRRDLLQSGKVAYTVHSGAYDKLGDAYAALEKWIGAQGFAPAGPPWESYLTDPTEHPDPKDWKTEVCWPIKPA